MWKHVYLLACSLKIFVFFFPQNIKGLICLSMPANLVNLAQGGILSMTTMYIVFGKCPKLFANFSGHEAYANSVDPDQTDCDGKSHTVCHSTMNYVNEMYANENVGKN